MWTLFELIIKHSLDYINNNLVFIFLILILIRALISIFLSVKGTVENIDEYIIRMKGIKAGFVCVYYERGIIIYLK